MRPERRLTSLTPRSRRKESSTLGKVGVVAIGLWGRRGVDAAEGRLEGAAVEVCVSPPVCFCERSVVITSVSPCVSMCCVPGPLSLPRRHRGRARLSRARIPVDEGPARVWPARREFGPRPLDFRALLIAINVHTFVGAVSRARSGAPAGRGPDWDRQGGVTSPRRPRRARLAIPSRASSWVLWALSPTRQSRVSVARGWCVRPRATPGR